VWFVSDRFSRARLERTFAYIIAAIEECDPAVVRSMKRQLNAIAAGGGVEAQSRKEYEASLGSVELRRRLAALTQKQNR
jgi:hypothetical protein